MTVIILGIDPGLANTGWGVIERRGATSRCVAYGCITTNAAEPLPARLARIHDEVGAVIETLPARRVRGRKRLLRHQREERVRDRPGSWCRRYSPPPSALRRAGGVLAGADQERRGGLRHGRQAPGDLHGASAASARPRADRRITRPTRWQWRSRMHACAQRGAGARSALVAHRVQRRVRP